MKPRTKFFPAVTEEYEADREAIAADVHETLADLQQRKLIEFT
jgi:hypothetical protein